MLIENDVPTTYVLRHKSHKVVVTFGVQILAFVSLHSLSGAGACPAFGAGGSSAGGASGSRTYLYYFKDISENQIFDCWVLGLDLWKRIETCDWQQS